ncbi:MAG: uncharacterized protein JWQ75_882, partial [Pseudarthrobacter sp.]|nr:uncharacterized protein [Pseudarthrobacter sp.]
LAEAQEKTFDAGTAREVEELRTAIADIARSPVQELLACDMEALHSAVGSTLAGVSEEVRGGYFAGGTDRLDTGLLPGADLAGADLRSRERCGAELRGACLRAADLRGRVLSGGDLLGADLRDARLDGADLAAALYLTQAQLDSARGSSTTVVPAGLTAPPHWLEA